ncbi:MotA/TolQ/ExbB proton channel family protein [Halothiobacillus sp. DCM-1]|uniref:MotA/TolQ/ExbB proton channel family protein n=1 Tax=Halothiobacillus sp. DCM-1 TaxID=3112558 RepID=UPI00324AD093
MTHSFDLAALWNQSDAVIRGVAFILLLMSVFTWFFILQRLIFTFRLRKGFRRFEQFWHAQGYAEGVALLGKPGRINPFRHLANRATDAVEHYYSHSKDLHSQLPLSEWLSLSLTREIDDIQEFVRQGMTMMASIGAVAPFIGLFGTVWGIYHALENIGQTGSASLATIAGPVGESLIMTAFGLAVAIPAVLAYNIINRQNRQLMGRIQQFAQQLHTYHISGIAPTRRAQAVVQQWQEDSV